MSRNNAIWDSLSHNLVNRQGFIFTLAKVLQDIFTNIGGKRNSLQVSLDIFNLGNLLNNNWGRVKQTTFNNFLEPQNVSSLTTAPNGPTPTFRFGRDNVTGQLLSTAFRDAVSLSSTYYMQLGLSYTFN
jgi:hypothetical protein